MRRTKTDKATPSTLRSQPIRSDVKGAPFRIGQRVQVRQLLDDTGLAKFLKLKGTVEHFEYNCGCGQSYPSDPMIGVRFASEELEEFWFEELRVLK